MSQGFTLIEVILYVSLVSIVASMLTIFAVQFLQLRSRSISQEDVLQQDRFIMDRILRNVRSSPGIDTGGSTFDDDNGVLALKGQTASAPRITYRIESNAITEAIGSASSIVLHTSTFHAAALRFHQAVSSDIQSSIEVTIGLESVSLVGAIRGAQATLTAQGSLRSNFPLHFTQADWSGGSGQATWSDQTRYSSDSGTINPMTCQGDVMLSNDLNEVVLWASDACSIHGNFRKVVDATAAGGFRIEDMPDKNLRSGGHFGNEADSAPVNYFDAAFSAASNKIYHFWGRFKIINTVGWDTSDSIYTQFSDSLSTASNPPAGRAINRIGDSEGLVPSCDGNPIGTWCWDDLWTEIANEGERMTFQDTGLHTIRIQRREDGYAIDQLVLSSNTYLNSAPNNNAILSKRYAASGTLTSSAYDTGAASVFGTLLWTAFTPPGTSVQFQIRTAADSGSLASASWRGAGGIVNGFYTVSNAGISIAHDGDRWVQYRITLNTTDITVTPVVSGVDISYIQ
jgi:type II secretory pathway pseudopilin PulG